VKFARLRVLSRADDCSRSRELLCQRCRIRLGKSIAFITESISNHSTFSASSKTNHAPLMLSVGRPFHFKGFDYLIEACAELNRRGLDLSA